MVRLANTLQLAFVCGTIAPLAEQANLNLIVMLEGSRSWLIGGSAADEAAELKRTGRWAAFARG